MSLGLDNLKSRIPLVAYDRLGDSLSRTKNITNKIRLAHFLSQVAHESGNFTVLYENLKYSANRLRVIFPKYFQTAEIANEYAMKSEKIANKVYANRMGNGNEASGDGYKFRGRGYLQVTGRSNYKLFSDYIGEDCVENPDLVATKYPMDSAIWFFDRNKLWSLCDKDDHASVLAVTKRVNGGTNGLADRLTKFRFFMKYLNS
jgi:putative chitinase